MILQKSRLKVLIIGYVWPELQSSAAGLRDWNLIETFQDAQWDVSFASPSKINSFTEQLNLKGIPTFSVAANDCQFDHFIKELNPDFVIFDRFVIEEQFGWRVAENCPQAIRVLDTQDLHFLRRARADALKAGLSLQQIEHCQFPLTTETTLRELASMYRCDGTLILSEFEMKLLIEKYQLNPETLFLSRFHYPPVHPTPTFEERKDFIIIGNFRHPPNADGILWFRKEIWPLIRKQLPGVSVHIFGAYPPKEMIQLTQATQGFHVIGPVEDQFETLKKYRVNLAPLRFGAGIKGKISDGWWSGTPVVATPIGAEGMSGLLPWGGEIESHPDKFAEAAVKLYSNPTLWTASQEKGFSIMRELYSKNTHSKQLIHYFLTLKQNCSELRERNVIGAILQLQQNRSTKYFSKWIEEKQKRALPTSEEPS